MAPCPSPRGCRVIPTGWTDSASRPSARSSPTAPTRQTRTSAVSSGAGSGGNRIAPPGMAACRGQRARRVELAESARRGSAWRQTRLHHPRQAVQWCPLSYALPLLTPAWQNAPTVLPALVRPSSSHARLAEYTHSVARSRMPFLFTHTAGRVCPQCRPLFHVFPLHILG